MTAYAIAQVIHARLYEDHPARDSMIGWLIREHVAQKTLTRLDDEHRVAYSFGQLVHANDCGRAIVLDDDGGPVIEGECSEGCAILPCDEADATVVMMMIEIEVENVE